MKRGVRVLVVAGGVRVGHEDRREPRGGQLEHRAARAGHREVRGRERVRERLDVRDAGGSEAASRARRAATRSESKSRVPDAWSTVHGATEPKASIAASFSRRAPSEPPNTSRQAESAGRSKPRPRGVAVGVAGAGAAPAARSRRTSSRSVPRAGTPGRPARRAAPASGSTRRGGCRPPSAPAAAAACGPRGPPGPPRSRRRPSPRRRRSSGAAAAPARWPARRAAARAPRAAAARRSMPITRSPWNG